MNSSRTYIVVGLLVVACVAVAGAQVSPGQKVSQSTNPPCCQVVAVDQAHQVATFRRGNQDFQFTIPCARTRQSVSVGQPVWANLHKREVSLDGHSVCSPILPQQRSSAAVGSTPAGTAPAGGYNLRSQASAATSSSAPSTQIKGAPPALGSAAAAAPIAAGQAANVPAAGALAASSVSSGSTPSAVMPSAPLPSPTAPSATGTTAGAGQGVYAKPNQVSLGGKTVPGPILGLPTLGGGSSGSSGTCNTQGWGVTVCSPVSGSSAASPVQISAAAVTGTVYVSGQPTTYPITAMRVFTDASSTSVYLSNAASVNTSLAMSPGSHNVLVRAWDSSGEVYDKSVGVTVSPGTGSSTTSGNPETPDPQPVSYSCPSSPDPTSDGCGKTGASATNVGAVTCGSSITITGIIPSGGLSDWLMFQVTTPRVNCANLVITASIGYSAGSQALFDVVQSPASPSGVFNSFNTTAGPAIGVPGIAGLGSITSPLQPGFYYIRVYGVTPSSAGTWTLMIKA